MIGLQSKINVNKRVNVDHTLVPQVQWMIFAADELVGFTFTLVRSVNNAIIASTAVPGGFYWLLLHLYMSVPCMAAHFSVKALCEHWHIL